MNKKRSIGVHDGSFHADEVTACAMLIMYNLADQDKISRTRDKCVLDTCEFVCDVGGVYDPSQKRFDHHQLSYEGELSSAGMILKFLYDSKIIDIREFDFFNKNLIHGVDEQDNGRMFSPDGYSSFSDIIKLYNPVEEESVDSNASFYYALDFTLDFLNRIKAKFIYNLECEALVKDAMLKNSIVMEFEKGISWQDCFFSMGGDSHKALFVLFKGGPHWILRGIPPSLMNRMAVRCPFPENWAGLLVDALKKESGISGGVFCHKGRFISVWETREDAMQAIIKTLEYNGVHYENSF